MRVVFAIGALASLSCASEPTFSNGEPLGRFEVPLVNGSDSDSSQDYVVLLVGLTQTSAGVTEFQCSGVLLAPNLILTARHCVSRTSDGPFGCDENGNLVPGSAGGSCGEDYSPSDLLVFVGATRPKFEEGVQPAAKVAKIVHDQSSQLCGHDVALAILDRTITGAKIAPIRLDAAAAAGEPITAIGWGTETTGSPAIRQQRMGISVVRVGPSPAAGDGSTGPVPPSEFEVGESSCSGDSGGPAISDRTGAVVGIVSAGGNGASGDRNNPAAGCIGSQTPNLYMEVSPFKDLILTAFRDAGATPWFEGGPNPSDRVASGCAVAASRYPATFSILFALILALGIGRWRAKRRAKLRRRS